MSSPRTTHNKPHPLWAVPTDTVTAIPTTASTAIGAGAPAGGRSGRPAEDAMAAEAWGPVRVLGRSRRRSSSSPGSRRKGTPRSVFELLGRQPARLEMLT